MRVPSLSGCLGPPLPLSTATFLNFSLTHTHTFGRFSYNPNGSRLDANY